MLTEEMIRSGSLNLYLDDDRSVVLEVDEYNKQAEECRIQRQKMQKYLFIFQFISAVYAFILFYVKFLNVLNFVYLMLVALAVFGFSLYYFCGKKQNLWMHALVSLPMLLYGVPVVPLLLGNVVTAYFHTKKQDVLRAKPGYPNFFEIQVHYIGEKRDYYDVLPLEVRGGNGMLVVDRLEGKTVVVELTNEKGETTIQNMPSEWIQGNVQAGDVLVKTHYGYAVDAEATQMRRQASVQQLHSLTEL